MGRADYLKLGDYNAICYECGKKFKASELKRHWQGYWVCEKHWEARHTQDFVKGTKDVQTPPWTQPLTVTLAAPYCTINGRSAVAGAAVADCAKADYVSPAFDPTVSS